MGEDLNYVQFCTSSFIRIQQYYGDSSASSIGFDFQYYKFNGCLNCVRKIQSNHILLSYHNEVKDSLEMSE